MSTAADVPFDAMLVSFLKEGHRRGLNITVLASDAHQIGRTACKVASNTGPAGVAFARQTLLMGANSDETVERVARALHEFRFVEQGKTAPAPEADMCMFGPCIATVPQDEHTVPASKLPWAAVSPELKEAHRVLVRLLIVAMVAEPEPPKDAKRLVIAST